MRLYVAGPMSSIGPPTYNFPAFEAAARTLRARGHDVVTPNEIDENEGWVTVSRTVDGGLLRVRPTAKYTYEGVLARDCEHLATCDGIVLLDGWEDSPGANRELDCAIQNGLIVYLDVDHVPTKAQEADDYTVALDFGAGTVTDTRTDWVYQDAYPTANEEAPPDVVKVTGYVPISRELLEDIRAAQRAFANAAVQGAAPMHYHPASDDPDVPCYRHDDDAGPWLYADAYPTDTERDAEAYDPRRLTSDRGHAMLTEAARLADHGEVRVTDPSTGGAKGSKPCQPGFLPPAGLAALGEVAGFGATKYSPTNYRRGFRWSLSLNALWRHVLAFQGGEDTDPESGLPHLAHAAWHALVLVQFAADYPLLDDRFGKPASGEVA